MKYRFFNAQSAHTFSSVLAWHIEKRLHFLGLHLVVNFSEALMVFTLLTAIT